MSLDYFFHSIFSEIKRSMRLSLPLIAAQLVYGLSGFISTAMVAHLGRDQLATNSLVWGVFITVILFFIGILNAVSVMISQSYGANDKKSIEIIAKQGIILACFFALPMMLVVWVAPYILILTGQNPTVISLAVPYFHSLAWCMLPLNFLIIAEQFLIGVSLTRLVLAVSLLEVPLEIFWFYVLVFGKLGFPQCGLSGIGYGFTAAVSTMIVVIWFYLKFAKSVRDYDIFSGWWKGNRKYLWELIRVGSPLGGMYVIEVSLLATLALLMGKLGNDVLAAHQIAYQCFIFALTIIFGLSQGATVRVGNEVGMNNKSGLKLAAYVNAGIGFASMVLIAICYLWIPKTIIGFDIDVSNPNLQAVVNYAVVFLSIATVLQCVDCFRLTAIAVLRGMKDTKIPMFVSLIGFWLIAFPCAYWFAFELHWGGVGIWWGLVVGLASAAVILIIRFHWLLKRVNLEELVTRS